ncbi:MAG: flagellar hook-length control protein FliK [Acidobacteria bacterium]|nr:flagellar hook-length control protein FliK [Acidobacteriota bacterium]
MKIESSKTTQAEKRISPSNKPETTFRSLFNPAEKLDSPPPTGGFAKVLEEARNQNAKDKDFISGRKTDCSEQNSETAQANKDEETGGNVLNRERVDEKNKKRDGDKGQSDEQDKDSAFALPGLQTAMKAASETAVPAARSILHVADLERIVSLIRTQNLKNVEQVVIALKHSVLEGLQIKLTIDENGTLKAEFLALNEQIRNQLNARKQEITQIFRERGVKLSDLNVQQGSEFARPANHSEANRQSDETSNSETADGAANTDDSGNQTSYRV